MKQASEKYWHGTFIIAIIIKIFTGIIETLSGALLLIVGPGTLMSIMARVAQGRLADDPGDFLFAFAHQYMHHLTTGTKVFAGLYILAHGLINLLLVLGLLKEKTQAYLVAVGVLISFMLYQIFRISAHHSTLLSVLTIFDAFFVLLIWHEYNYLTRKLSSRIS